jgi:fumarate hydratase class II
MSGDRSPHGDGDAVGGQQAQPDNDPSGPTVQDLPVGLDASGTRTERDSLGVVEVPADRYWGAQTQRALNNFPIGDHPMPLEVVHAYGLLKRACAEANGATGGLPAWKAELIASVSDEVAAGSLDDHFPLGIWQSGSGTPTHMNVNEVITNRSIQLVGGVLGSKEPVHPNDDVNLGQSSNDTFPTAMHIAAHGVLTSVTTCGLEHLRHVCHDRQVAWDDVVRVGRTHLQDATPLTVGQGFSAYVSALDDALAMLGHATAGLCDLAIGGTAVGTGLNAPAGFDHHVTRILAALTGTPFRPATNKFAALSTIDPIVAAHAALRSCSVVLTKVANDLRWLASGPHAGIGELRLPANEPGSSIMPGKVNPTQAEAVVMACQRVMGNDVTIGLAAAGGHFELNTCRPVAIAVLIESARLVGDSARSLADRMVAGAELATDTIADHLARSVMGVTALAPTIGYDRAATIAQRATREGTTLRDAAIAEGVDGALFDQLVDHRAMTRPHASDSPDDPGGGGALQQPRPLA